uniref:RING-type domain-containing protein n=1 Tax=Oryza meridionalis TaxID=40149 RepID=A0A0E0ETR1_9ORYZ
MFKDVDTEEDNAIEPSLSGGGGGGGRVQGTRIALGQAASGAVCLGARKDRVPEAYVVVVHGRRRGRRLRVRAMLKLNNGRTAVSPLRGSGAVGAEAYLEGIDSSRWAAAAVAAAVASTGTPTPTPASAPTPRVPPPPPPPSSLSAFRRRHAAPHLHRPATRHGGGGGGVDGRGVVAVARISGAEVSRLSVKHLLRCFDFYSTDRKFCNGTNLNTLYHTTGSWHSWYPVKHTEIKVVGIENSEVLADGSKGVVKVRGPQDGVGSVEGWLLLKDENVEPAEIEEDAGRNDLINQIAVGQFSLLDVGMMGCSFQISPILIVDESFTVDDGLLTSTLKIRRDKVGGRPKKSTMWVRLAKAGCKRDYIIPSMAGTLIEDGWRCETNQQRKQTGNRLEELKQRKRQEEEEDDDDEERWGVISNPVVTACGHIFCRLCLAHYMSSSLVEGTDCPVCKTRMDHLPRTCNLIGRVISILHPGKGNADEVDGIRSEDVACLICQELLFDPSVLNCGHVYCMPCLTSVGGEELECQFCGAPHPAEPTVCSNLKNFLKHRFEELYNSRQEKSSGVPSRKEGTRKGKPSEILHTHVGVGCDGCGVFPIQGRRYSCKECEAPGLDLCEKCFMTGSTAEGRFDQKHTADHDMELDDSFLFPNLRQD